MKKKLGRGILLLPAGAVVVVIIPAPPAVDEIESMAMSAFVTATMATATTTMKDEFLMMATGGCGGDSVDSYDDHYHGDIDDDGVASYGFGGGGMSQCLTWRGWRLVR